MNNNPILKKLGFDDSDRVLIIHADDIGMCHASIAAYIDLLEFGLISSAAVMVPCSWFPKVVNICLQEKNVDMGIHLTLTSEWDSYRWSPISTCDNSSGLIDQEGYFYHTSEAAQLYGSAESANIELEAQIEKAIKEFIDITHLDTHMNTVAHPKYISSYIQLAIKYKLPLLYPRLDAKGFQKLGFDSDISSLAAQSVSVLEELGVPLPDHAAGMNLLNPKNRFDQLKLILKDIPEGITHFIIHPSKDTPELRDITPDWECRAADYQIFIDAKTSKYIRDEGFHVIGYRALKNLFG